MRLRRATQFACLFAFALSCHGRPRSSSGEEVKKLPDAAGPGELAELDLTNGAPEALDSSSLFSLPASKSYAGLVRAIERIERDEPVTGVFVRIGGAELGWARAEELGRLLGKLQKTKKVVCHAHVLSNAMTWFALRGCERVWLSPAGSVDTVGIAAQMVYFKNALDRLHIDVDFLHMGTFKSGVEPFTREGPSEAARENLTSTLASIRATWLSEADSARSGKALRGPLEHGPWTPKLALEEGLIDAIGFENEALSDAKQRAKAGTMATRFGQRQQGDGFDPAQLIRLLSGVDEAATGRPHIAVVPAEGGITMQAGGPLESGGITATALTKTIRKLTRNDAVKAVVLRLNSPGGSPLASDLIWHELMELKKKKPVVVSIGDMAASGGYYIAAAAQRVVAERTSIVGSIGVFGGKVVLAPALGELGVNAVTFPASPEPGAEARAAYLSPLTAWDEATRDRVRQQMQSIYDLFVARVAEGRKLSNEEVRKHAEGRIFSGAEAKDRKLVDELGGLGHALDIARKLSGLDREAPVTVEGTSESLLEQLFLGEAAEASEARAAIARASARHSVLFGQLPKRWVPVVSSLRPLLQDEPVVAALPYGLFIE